MKHDDGTSRRSQIQLGSAFSNLRGIPTDSNPRGVPTDFNEPYNAQYNAPYNAPLMGEAAQLGMNATASGYIQGYMAYNMDIPGTWHMTYIPARVMS